MKFIEILRLPTLKAGSSSRGLMVSYMSYIHSVLGRTSAVSYSGLQDNILISYCQFKILLGTMCTSATTFSTSGHDHIIITYVYFNIQNAFYPRFPFSWVKIRYGTAWSGWNAIMEKKERWWRAKVSVNNGQLHLWTQTTWNKKDQNNFCVLSMGVFSAFYGQRSVAAAWFLEYSLCLLVFKWY